MSDSDPPPPCSSDALRAIGGVLNDPARPLKERFRALFTLKNLGGAGAVEEMARCFADESALLKHEVAYCLGQMGDERAVKKLVEVLDDEAREPIVRHEAGEALGAIAKVDKVVMDVLKKRCEDKVPEVRVVITRSVSLPVIDPLRTQLDFQVADTCRLAVARIEYFSSDLKENLPDNPYNSVDPTPPFANDMTDVSALKAILMDPKESLFRRYRALFSLRNIGSDESVLAAAEGLKCTDNALLRHEVAYVLGQIQSRLSSPALTETLRDEAESDMVRHECAEALGSVSGEDIEAELRKYLGQEQPSVLRESCVVALDFNEYNQSKEFQYANALGSVGGTN